MYTYKIVAVDTAYSQASNSHFLDVEVEFYKGEDADSQELAFNRKFGFDLDSTKETILEEMEKHCTTFASDAEVAANSAALEASLSNAESLKQELLK